MTPDERTAYEAKKRQNKLSALERSEQKIQGQLTTADDYVTKSKNNIVVPGSDNSTHQGALYTEQSVDEIRKNLAAVSAEKEKLLDSMNPDKIALASADTKAGNAHDSKNKLTKDAAAAKIEADANRSKTGAINASKISAIDDKKKVELLGADKHQGYGLNSQQRLGAYASTPPDFKRLVDAAIRTAQNTDSLRPGNFNPPGSKPPQYGGRTPAH